MYSRTENYLYSSSRIYAEMELGELLSYDEERCKRERPLLYLATYFGKDVNYKEEERLFSGKRKVDVVHHRDIGWSI